MSLETMIADLTQRFDSLNQPMTEAQIRALVNESLSGLADDKEFVRKMRFGASDTALIGSKFARYGLSPADLEFAYDLMMSRKSRGLSGPSEELTTAFRTLSDAQYMSEDEIKRIDRQAIDELYPRITKHNQRQYEAVLRAMDTAESGYGSQLIGAQYVGDLWTGARADARIFNQIRTFEMTAPTAYLPVEADIPEMLLVAESTANNSSNYTTTKTGSNRIQVTAKKFVIHQMWSGEMEEDSIIPFVPFLREQLARSLAFYSDSAVLNGDTTNAATGNINSDDEDPADTKHFLAFDGIRHAALVDNTANDLDVAGAVSLDTLRELRKLLIDRTYLHDWGHPTNPADLLIVADPETADNIAAIDELISARIHNGGRDLLNGEVSAWLGHPVIASIASPLTEADGKVSYDTPSNNVKGQINMFNRNGLVAGWRRRVKLETERLPATDQDRIVASLRMGLGRFAPTGAASGIEWAATGFNITV